jgi:VCBS repeat-containing protein
VYRLTDADGDSDTATVTITVNSVDDPVDAQDDAYTTPEDTPLTVPAPGVLANDSYPDGVGLLVVVSGPSQGTLTLNQDGSFTYTPNPNFHGTDTFVYRLTDADGDSDTATVTINVAPVNDPPVAANNSYSTNEDTPLSVAAPGVLGNDTDVENNPLTAVLVTGPANASAFTLNPDGSFTYTPKPDWYGTDTFTYKANDGQLDSNVATVTITVNPVLTTAQRSFPAGWNLLSVPLKPVPPDNTPVAVFGDDVSPLPLWIHWGNPSANPPTYQPPAVVDPGRGYWVYLMSEGTVIDVEGTRVDQGDYEVQLGAAGWQMISTPTVSVFWGYVRFRLGTETRSYTDAVAAGWVAPLAFRYDPATYSYVTLSASGTIDPWFGYWIRTYVDNLVLILPVYDAIHNPPPLPASTLGALAGVANLTPPPPPTLPMADKSGLVVLNYPNPIRDVHTTRFMVLGAAVERMRVTIYDLSGRLVWKGEVEGNELAWHTGDLTGKFLANGVYLYIVEVRIGGQWVRSEVKKLVILR